MDQLQLIQSKIYEIRGQKVMLDRDLAEMYGVETRVLNQAVKRNLERFPEDFMFRLTDDEMQNWKSQIVMSNSVRMGIRRNPYAFTELGVAMQRAQFEGGHSDKYGHHEGVCRRKADDSAAKR